MYTTATLTTLIDSRGNGFSIDYEDFTRLLGTELAADKLLACLFRWTRWSDSNETPEQRAERDGWIRKSGRELFDEIKLTRIL